MKKLIFGVLGALALVGCGGGGSNGGSSSTKPRVAYVNASPDAGALDFYLSDDKKASAVAFGTSTDFAETSAKDFDVSIHPASNSEIIWDEAKTFSANTDNLVIAVGLRTPPVDETQVPPVTELDKRLVLSFGNIDRRTPTGNRARLILVDAFVRKAGFGTPQVDFRNPGDTPVFETLGLSFGGIRAVDVDSGDQTFQVRQNGTEQVFIQRTFTGASTLKAGGLYVALISGLEDASGDSAPDIRLIPLPTRD